MSDTKPESVDLDIEEVYVITSGGKMHIPPDHPEMSPEKCNIPYNVEGRVASIQALLPLYDYCAQCFPSRQS